MREAWSRRGLILLPALAFGLWCWAFAVPAGNFWIKISISAATLATLSRLWERGKAPSLRLNLRTILLGLSAAGVLYIVFMIGRLTAIHLFGFADAQIGGIYAKGSGTPLWGIALLLFFVTGPSEEIFWRGYLQRGLQKRFGGTTGYLLATALYAAVHIPSLNFMLVGAAAVAGAFWGAFYWGSRNLTAAILSHSIWSTVIFTILPLH
ncbi:MAG: type II CAAX endopeptidase family protein [Deltaproteobacteria bacterium]|nr:type II CAAX endopeptidase family protein [Deltaproteobacteria bacterium]